MSNVNEKKGIRSDNNAAMEIDVDKVIEDTMREMRDDINQSEEPNKVKKEVRKEHEQQKPDGQQRKRKKKKKNPQKSETMGENHRTIKSDNSSNDLLSDDDLESVSELGEAEELEDDFDDELDFVVPDELDDFYDEDDMAGKKTKKKKKGQKKGKGGKAALITIGSIAAVLAIAYIGISSYFTKHFYINTSINGVNFSGKTVADVENYMSSEVQGYTLTIEEQNDVSETISGSDISLAYVQNDDIKNALKKQEAFLWPQAFFQKKSTDVTVDVSYDEEALAAKIAELKCVTAEQTEPVSATPVFDGNSFVVQAETYGNKIDSDKLNQLIREYISGFKSTLNMSDEACYAVPKYTSESPEVQAACDAMNKYCAASITYSMNPVAVVDKTLISTWVTVDGDMNVSLNNDAVVAYMSEFGKTYDTVGKERPITTPGGKTTTVVGGTYGWSIDEATEAQNLINSITAGEVVTREPAYEQTAASHDQNDWGRTYAEVDLTDQHMWYISDGSVIFETDVVTGLPTPDKETPQGVWSCLERMQNKTLTGAIQEDGQPEYETPVAYWMRVTWTGVGFHTATWQPYFGGTRYQTNGSHGCINMSYSDSETLYGIIQVGDPVIIHY